MSEEVSQSILTDRGFLVDQPEADTPMHEKDQPDPCLSSERKKNGKQRKRQRFKKNTKAHRPDRSETNVKTSLRTSHLPPLAKAMHKKMYASWQIIISRNKSLRLTNI